ncbi:Ubiquitin domain-containing protein 2 [Mortierella sp. AD031]|nr:Ubiquitin domain-containing protein 2 [Mortierella sp. AD031]
MGCCSSQPVDDDTEPGYGGRRIYSLKNHRWNAPAPPPTRTQLDREREEFWDTAPAYDGRPEVWQALRAACDEEDPDQMQAILDAARVTVPSSIAPELTAGGMEGPSGSQQQQRRGQSRNQRQDPMAQLTCYDHLGNLYIIPLKVLSDPSNIVEDSRLGEASSSSSSGSSRGDGGQGVAVEESDVGLIANAVVQQPVASSGKAMTRREHKDSTVVPADSSVGQPKEVVRIRVSNSQKEASLLAAGTQTIGQIKAQLVEGRLVGEKSVLRVFFLGRVLDDKERLQDISHFQMGPQGTVLQVLVTGV